MGILNRNAPRRELKRIDLARRGLVAVAAGSLVLAFTYLLNTGTFSDDPQVNTVLRNVGGSLAKGSDVKMKGALIGKVKSIESREGRVSVVLTMDKEALENVPANVTARVLPATVFGTSFIDLTAPKPAAAALKAGADIPEDVSKPTIELQQALDDIDRLVKALGPAELASAIGSVAEALDGRGQQIGDVIDRSSAFLAKVNPRMPLVREDLTLLADNLEIVSAYAPDLLTALDDSLVAAATLVEQRAQITTLMTGGLTLVQNADAFLGEHESRFIRSIQLASIVTDAVYDNRRSGLHDSFYANTRFAQRGTPALQGTSIPTDLFVVADNPAFYTGADCPRYQGSYGCGSTRSTQRLMGGSLMDGGDR